MAILSGTEVPNSSYINILYNDLQILLNNNLLVTGQYYKITDKGDNGILIQSTDINKLNTECIRFMLCPKYYDIDLFDGNDWLGVWNPTLTPSIGNLTIWGGYVWESITGVVSSSINDANLDPTDWTKISKTISVYYEERQFNIRYDFNNDWIELQKDDYGNECGIDYVSFSQGYASDFNTTDLTDWNLTRSSNFIFANNKGLGYWNNSNVTTIINCIINRGISNNYNIDNIQDVYNVGRIQNNNDVFQINQCYNINNISNNYNIDQGINYCSDIPNGINNNHDIPKIEKINDCSSISNCNNITYGIYNNNGLLGISNITNIDNVNNHLSRYFTIIMDFNNNPLIVGIPQFVDVIIDQGVFISEIVAVGNDLDPLTDIGALISIGIDIDDPNYIIPTTLSDYNDGVKLATLSSNKTSISNRKIRVAATVEDVTVGSLTIVIRHS